MIFDRSFMDNTQKTICQLLANTLFQEEFTVDADNDQSWQEIFEESNKQAVVIPAFLKYDKIPLNKSLKDEVKNAVKTRVFQSIQNYSFHSYLHELMTENGVSYCILKGVASCRYYPEKMSRQMGDVDFLIEEKDVKTVTSILERNGFVSSGESHEFHTVFTNGSIQLEMHFKPFIVPGGMAGEAIQNYFKDIQKTSVRFKDAPFEFQIPDDFHHGLVMLLHVQRHLVGEGVGLRHLCDWAVFVNNFSEKEFESLFRERLEKAGLWTFARIFSLAAVVSIGLPYQKWMGSELELGKALVQDMMSGGNFGRKNSQRAYEGMLISDRGKGNFSHNPISQLFRTMNQISYTYWPFMKKIKIILPAGWIYLGIRYIFRMLLGRRSKIKIGELYANSLSRKELYKKLELFEV